MNEITHAIAGLIENYSGWLILLLFLGGGDAIGRALSGRRANAALKAELKATKNENTNLKELGAANNTSIDGSKIGKLAGQARDALDDNTDLLNLLHQIHAADCTYPQLAQPIRDHLDDIIGRHRNRRTPLAAAKKTKGKA